MKHITAVLGGVLLVVFLAAGCGRFTTTSIGDILNRPRDYAGKTVTVSGEVKEIFSLVLIRYFVVQDTTGQIAVVTDKPLPRKGTTIKVTGTVREAFSIGDQQLLVLIEGEGK